MSGRKRAAPEEALHRAVAEWLDLISGGATFFWWHTPNGGARTKAEAGALKAMGVRAGVPDILILQNGYLYGIELKAAGGGLSPAQVATVARLQAEGCRVAVARSLEEVDHLVADVWRLPMRCRPRLFGSAA